MEGNTTIVILQKLSDGYNIFTLQYSHLSTNYLPLCIDEGSLCLELTTNTCNIFNLKPDDLSQAAKFKYNDFTVYVVEIPPEYDLISWYTSNKDIVQDRDGNEEEKENYLNETSIQSMNITNLKSLYRKSRDTENNVNVGGVKVYGAYKQILRRTYELLKEKKLKIQKLKLSVFLAGDKTKPRFLVGTKFIKIKGSDKKTDYSTIVKTKSTVTSGASTSGTSGTFEKLIDDFKNKYNSVDTKMLKKDALKNNAIRRYIRTNNIVYNQLVDGVQEDAAEFLNGTLEFDNRLQQNVQFTETITDVCYNKDDMYILDEDEFPPFRSVVATHSVLMVDSDILRREINIPTYLFNVGEKLKKLEARAGCNRLYIDSDFNNVDQQETRNMLRRNEYLESHNMSKLRTRRNTVITNLGDFLIVHLKRMTYVTDTKSRQIRHSKIAASDISIKIDDQFEHEGNEFTLCGMIFHSGMTCNDGHYIAHVKTNGDWYSANDGVVKKMKNDNSVYRMLGQRAGEKPYMLMYKKDTIAPVDYAVKGIANIGNSCYVNASLQILMPIIQLLINEL